ncbi:hypothetical protein BJ875DRAFT_373112 [Amylocarpus encephaloides]|uniref:Uncharacterized protein n=1 Tax=Amylocarpus encephaloides TaxID=45428 RepID=A0A9P8C746_9HELO|nr:hypothetical protein BJ875DRAFT_373112 [Amylocarpus encephaloides]
MSYGIMGSSGDTYMLTYLTTRRTKCIYFDGASATVFGYGQMDTQMLHIWGNVSGPPINSAQSLFYEEYARAAWLCDWLSAKGLRGPGWGYEGIVRMNAGFEMIWCDFNSPSIKLISHLNVTPPLLPKLVGRKNMAGEGATSYFPLPPSPTRTDKSNDPSNIPIPRGNGSELERNPFMKGRIWNWFASGADHYGSSGDGPGHGEVRVKVISCGFLSYYSPVFFTQARARADEEGKYLNLTKEGYWAGPGTTDWRSHSLDALTRRRRWHALDDISPAAATTMRHDLEKVLSDSLSESPAKCSGIDWTIMSSEIIQTYAGPLKVYLATLMSSKGMTRGTGKRFEEWLTVVRDQTHSFLAPFLEYPEHVDEDTWKRGSKLFNDTYSQCRFQYTRLLGLQGDLFLGPQEILLKWAVEEVLGVICSVLVEVGLSIEGLSQSTFNPGHDEDIFNVQSLQTEVARWTQGVEQLMAWLGWAGEWTRCEEKCAWDEKCYIPMWPLIAGEIVPDKGHNYSGYDYRHSSPHRNFPPNRTSGIPGRGWQWLKDDTTLWKPICAKVEYLVGGGKQII